MPLFGGDELLFKGIYIFSLRTEVSQTTSWLYFLLLKLGKMNSVFDFGT